MTRAVAASTANATAMTTSANVSPEALARAFFLIEVVLESSAANISNHSPGPGDLTCLPIQAHDNTLEVVGIGGARPRGENLDGTGVDDARTEVRRVRI